MSTTAGIIFSNLNTVNNTRLTEDRTVAAIPFACRYRLGDFALSNMVNAEISNIHVIANYNYHSLVEHIGSGKDWDLARHGAGIRMVTPYQNTQQTGAKLYTAHLEALVDVAGIIDDIHEENVVCCDSDVLCNIDLSRVIAYHDEVGADITLVTVPAPKSWSSRYQRPTVRADAYGKVTDLSLNTSAEGSYPEFFLNLYVMKTNYLRTLLATASAHNYKSFTRDILMRKTDSRNYYRYLYDGYYAFVADFGEYYTKSMELVRSPEARLGLLGVKERPIYTNVHNTAPTKYGEGAEIVSSMIADDCVIEGRVENCILFRGVHIGKGSVIRNSIIMGGTYIGKNVTMDAVVCDKSALISDGRTLAGCAELPYFIPKNKHI